MKSYLFKINGIYLFFIFYKKNFLFLLVIIIKNNLKSIITEIEF